MLAGVSHDLRTVLTRFKLQLALFEDTPELEAMRADVDEMQAMLEDYMAFAKGDAGEEIVRTDIGEILSEVKSQAHGGKAIAIEVKEAPLVVPVRRHAFKRAVANLVNNAARFAEHVNVSAAKQNGALTVAVEDDGPGIPEAEREQVFRPFYRIDHARNQDFGLDRARPGDRPRHRPHSRRRHRAQPIPARRLEGCAKSPGLNLGREPLGGDISCVDVALGVAAAMAVSFAGPVFAEDMTEEIQEDEQPGSEIELGIGGGEATIERKSGAPVFHPGDVPMMAPGAGTSARRAGRSGRADRGRSRRCRAAGRRTRGSLRSRRRRRPPRLISAGRWLPARAEPRAGRRASSRAA